MEHIERGHLRLVRASTASPEPRLRLLLRAMLAGVRILAENALALAGAAAALLPLLAQGRPPGRRHLPRPALRVVALPPWRRTGSPP